jgi:hypothetical protein
VHTGNIERQVDLLFVLICNEVSGHYGEFVVSRKAGICFLATCLFVEAIVITEIVIAQEMINSFASITAKSVAIGVFATVHRYRCLAVNAVEMGVNLTL